MMRTPQTSLALALSSFLAISTALSAQEKTLEALTAEKLRKYVAMHGQVELDKLKPLASINVADLNYKKMPPQYLISWPWTPARPDLSLTERAEVKKSLQNILEDVLGQYLLTTSELKKVEFQLGSRDTTTTKPLEELTEAEIQSWVQAYLDERPPLVRELEPHVRLTARLLSYRKPPLPVLTWRVPAKGTLTRSRSELKQTAQDALGEALGTFRGGLLDRRSLFRLQPFEIEIEEARPEVTQEELNQQERFRVWVRVPGYPWAVWSSDHEPGWLFAGPFAVHVSARSGSSASKQSVSKYASGSGVGSGPAGTSDPDLRNRALVVVHLPASSSLFLDGQPTRKDDRATRSILTPPLEPGFNYSYELRVETVTPGERVIETRRVYFQPGRRVEVSFQVPDRAGDK